MVIPGGRGRSRLQRFFHEDGKVSSQTRDDVGLLHGGDDDGLYWWTNDVTNVTVIAEWLRAGPPQWRQLRRKTTSTKGTDGRKAQKRTSKRVRCWRHYYHPPWRHHLDSSWPSCCKRNVLMWMTLKHVFSIIVRKSSKAEVTFQLPCWARPTSYLAISPKSSTFITGSKKYYSRIWIT